jgi:regulator of sigma E protease
MISEFIVINDLVLLAAKPSFWFDPASYWAIARVVLGLGLVIFIHELGHFLVAKACGVKCDKFYVGFDAFDIKLGDRVIIPRSLLKWQWGETEYGIGILPLGGYVKMLGQDDNPANYQKEVERSRTMDGANRSSHSNSEQLAMAEAGLIDRSQLDPRSFLAKSVIQRIAIISAGVIFNLISAIFFAAIAFKSGVNFMPALVGSTVGGGPAWEQNLAGADIKRVGDRTTEGYFTWIDMAEQFVFNGDEKPLAIEYVPYGETKSKQVNLTPRTGLSREYNDLSMGGLSFRLAPKVGELDNLITVSAIPPLKADDRIVAINGKPIKSDVDLRSSFVRWSNQEVEFTIERSADQAKRETKDGHADTPETLQVKIKPNPVRTIGFSLEWLPIAKIQVGSPAEKAGLKVGDEIIRVDGQPRGSLTNFNERLLNLVHEQKSVELEIRRDQKTETITVKPEYYLLPSTIGFQQPKSVDCLGLAIPVSLKVDSVDPGSSAEQGGMKVADEIVSVKYLLNEEQKKAPRYAGLKQAAIELVNDKTSWPEIDFNLQTMEVGTEVELIVKRNGVNELVRVKTAASESMFQDIRGIALSVYEDYYQSNTWSDAFYYGAKQVVRDLKRVGTTLVKLIRGKISPTNLGGPGTIAMVATSEASQGNSRLLLFLAFLSANLAVVNLLPIPVLDGGHLLFLAYEGIFRRPVNEKTQIILTYAGLAMILSLMVFVVALDIGRISKML